ncbi:MAG: dihydroorotase [Hyphomicrobiales bacterium]|nr:dihydroorotase [Hyphomicrobiales bacterium]MDE2114000.1 dihydroorotase [Hyphomicrobiales bacterium]
MATLHSNATALINANLVNPGSETQGKGGVLVEAGHIVDFGPHIEATHLASGTKIIDCSGDCLSPGLIDAQVFVGEPGAEYRETIATVTRAAAAGGVTTIVATPDSDPPVDNPAIVDFLKRLARDKGRVRVLAAAALTKGLNGAEISEIGLLQEAGAVAFSHGPHSLKSALVMRRALTYARDFDALIMHTTHDATLAADGVMNEGERASRLGLAGIPLEAESIMLERDLRLVALTGARYHASIVTCRQSLDLIRKAKAEGLQVTCGTTINHLTLNENDIGDYRTFLKLMPPLRAEPERRALVEALAEGVIDIIVSDHNPQDVEVKRLPFGEAAFGAIGVETLLAAALRLVHSGDVSLPRLLAALTYRPAQILRLPQGCLAKGAPADLIRFDPDEPFVLDATQLHSRAKNTPFDEARLSGRVKMTMVAGNILHG